MLEEALTSDTFPPADAALALLTFIRFQLPEGGANAEARFLHLFPLLCERLFGRISGPKDGFQHEIGGWLARQDRWERPSSASTTTSSSTSPGIRGSVHSPLSSRTSSIDKDPVVELLHGIDGKLGGRELPTLIDAISAEDENRPTLRFPFPLHALPKPTQEVFLQLLQSAMSGKPPEKSLRENSARLAGSLLRVHPRDQTSLKAYHLQRSQSAETKRSLTLSPGLAFSPQKLSDDKNQDKVEPQLLLTMLESYLFLFVHYPLAPPPIQSSGSSSSPGFTRGVNHYPRRSSSYGEDVYLHLFRTYIRHFLPHGDSRTFADSQSLTREQELFLRTVIEFWIDGSMVIPTMSKATAPIRQRTQQSGAPGDVVFDLGMSYDLINVKYEPPPGQVVRCLRSLLNHAVKDPGIGRAVADAFETAASYQATARVPELPWCLSPCMTMLQLPFYNFLRATFRYASIHATTSPFHAAMEAWLVWIEPWNVEMHKKNAVTTAKNAIASRVANSPTSSKQSSEAATPIITRPKAQSRSRYLKKWEPYIAANLHYYTVPLAIFLRRARELDFSPRYFRRSLELVQRVLRVYSPEVVHSITGLLQDPASRLGSLVAQHNRTLGDYSPSSLGGVSLTSCRSDMHNLLEEMYAQHFKALKDLDIFDRFLAYVGLGEVTTSEEKDMRIVVEKARVIVGFPPDYDPMPDRLSTSRDKSSSAKSDIQPERSRTGLLTEKGRADLSEGAVRCSPAEIVFVGDRMTMRPNSHEIAQLVPLTIKASNFLNTRLGLSEVVAKEVPRDSTRQISVDASGLDSVVEASRKSSKGWFRINLRFLADYRNLLVIVFVAWLWRKM